jgi:CHAT domain-containing protein/Flp pilus assembly protein TadD
MGCVGVGEIKWLIAVKTYQNCLDSKEGFMKIITGLIFIFLWLTSPAQLLKDLKNKAIAKIKTSSSDAGTKELEKTRAQFDSTDFNYALLLSDISSSFNVREKGEFAGKFLTLRDLGSSFYKNIEFSDDEKAQFDLQAGEAAYAMGRFVFAEKRFDAARSIYERTNQTKDLGYLKTISDQGLLYTTMGRFAQAETFTSEALRMQKTELGPTDMVVASSLNNYGVLHYDLGYYNESEKDFAASVSIIQSNRSQSEMPYAIVLNNKAILFQSMGRYEEAVKALLEAIAVAEKLENSKSRNHLKFLSNLALLYQQMNKYEEAENIYLDMQNRFLLKNKPDYANVLNNLAVLYLVTHKDEKVEGMLKQAASIYKSNFGEDHPAYAKVISDLGNFYLYKGRYEEAQPLLMKALDIRHQTLGANHPMYVQSQEDMAILYWKLKSFDKASPIYHDVMEKSLDFINRYFPPMSEAEKTKYWDLLSQRFQRFYNFAVEAGSYNKDIFISLFEYSVDTKGLLLNSTRKITQNILESNDAQLIQDYLLWIDEKEELVKLYAYSKEELKEQNINIDSLETAANDLEKKLSENSKEFSQGYFASKTTFAEIQSRLNEDEALIQFVRARNYDSSFTNNCKYIALVVTKNNSQPGVIIFQNGNELETQYLKAYRFAIQSRSNDDQSYAHYWERFEAEVKNKKTIYASLDGVYNQINLNTLHDPQNGFLISTYNIVLLGNPKDILRNNQPNAAPGKQAVLIGYPDYGAGKIPELPGTKAEVDTINKILKSFNYSVTELTRKNATEANLKSTKRPVILHIATHGYFLLDVEKARWPIGVTPENANDNVLLRSGLLLSGASEADKFTSTLDRNNNGILTSYEAMDLDLKGTGLVVLSACETGLGEIRAGEGVYGLERAFLVAGAEALIMSLWKVDDAATQELMTIFYSNWIKTGNKQQAFKQAQLQLMAKYKEPYYWGAFSMIGD